MTLLLVSVADATAWLAAQVGAAGAAGGLGCGSAALRTDSRQVQPGDVFIAWPGQATDGRQFVASALAAGALACLVEADGLAAFGLPSDDARIASLPGLKAATGPLAAAWFGAPASRLTVIAVTGTNGKSSTAWWTAQALTALGQRCGVVGTLGIGEPPPAMSGGEPPPAAPGGEPPPAVSGGEPPLPGAAGTVLHNGLTTPDPVTLQAGLRQMADAGFAACAVEASSIGLAEHRLAGTAISVAQFTNFTRDHLDFHADMATYWAAKRALFDWPGLRAAVVNIDDAQGAELAAELSDPVSRTRAPKADALQVREPKADALQVRDRAGVRAHEPLQWHPSPPHPNPLTDAGRRSQKLPAPGFEAELAVRPAHAGLDLWTTAVNHAARLRAENLGYSDGGLSFTAVEGEARVPVRSRLIGDYNASNLLAVLGALRALGVPLAQAAAVLPGLTPVPGRMQRVPSTPNQPELVVDYAHTPDALDKALAALRPLAKARGGPLWCVFGCGGDRDASKRPMMGAIAHRLADQVVLTSDNPRHESPALILAQILAGMCADPAVAVIEDRRAAIHHAVRCAAANDVLLLAGKGHEDYQDAGGIKKPFLDSAVAAEALAQRGPA